MEIYAKYFHIGRVQSAPILRLDFSNSNLCHFLHSVNCFDKLNIIILE